MSKEKELGIFVKEKRQSISPEQYGISTNSKRRVTGLRREELASLAGISEDWLTRIEQGRQGVTPSISVLDSLSRILQLNDVEKKYFYKLANNDLNNLVRAKGVSEGIQIFLDNQNPNLAYVMNYDYTVIAWNHIANQIYHYENQNDKERNLIWRAFKDPFIKSLSPNWESYARLRVQQAKAIFSLRQDDDFIQELMEDLYEEVNFRNWWNESRLEGTPEGQKVLKHPKLGDLYLNHLTLQTTDYNGVFIVILFAADTETKRKLETVV